MKVFSERFVSLGGGAPQQFSVTTDTASATVKKYLSENAPRTTGSKRAALVIGYGDMVSATLKSLIEEGFEGPIACTSTLTEPEWQPMDKSADDRIFTVLPLRLNARTPLTGDDRNVVFLFSKKTLSRVLSLTSCVKDTNEFVTEWLSQKNDSDLDQDCLSNGDTIVHLDVVGSDKWR